MKRLVWVALFSLSMLAALLSVHGFDARSEPADEILAYEVSRDFDVSVSVPGGVERVLITTWLLVPLGSPDEPFPYGIETELFGFEGKRLAERRFETRSRLSDVARGANVAAARLADASAWVCEPRTFELDVSALGGRAGMLRLRPRREDSRESRILLRLTHAVERGELESQILERTLSAREVERIMARRSSLGFFDIPLERRTMALSSWQRRLTAQGREGRDYSSRRLLLGGPEDITLREPWRSEGLFSAPNRRLALNLLGGATVRIEAVEQTTIMLQDGWEQTPSRHLIEAGQSLDLELANRGLRTLQIFSTEPRRLRLTTPADEQVSWVSARESRAVGDAYEVSPDFRYKWFYLLHPRQPIRFDMAPNQGSVGLTLRGLMQSGETARQLEVSALWRDAEGEPVSNARYSSSEAVSQFESLEEQVLSERAVTRLRVPEGAVRLELYGAPRTLVAAYVSEPGVESPVLRPPYDQLPPETMHWRFAPWEVAPFAAVHPDNLERLEEAGRAVRISTQVRLEPIDGELQALEPRVLSPVDTVTSRYLMRAEAYIPGMPFPANAWVLVDSARASGPLAVPDSGRLPWMYLAPPRALGGHWSLHDRGAELLSEPVVVTAGRGSLELSRDTVDLRFDGLGGNGVLALKARPQSARQIFKRQSVYRLTRGQWLTFTLQRRQSERPSVVLMLVSRGRPVTSSVEYRVDHGKLRTHQGFFTRLTEAEGRQEVVTGQFGRGLLWQLDSDVEVASNADYIARWVIPLGDDLVAGQHQLSVRLGSPPGAGELWVRAVLVGRMLAKPSGGVGN